MSQTAAFYIDPLRDIYEVSCLKYTELGPLVTQSPGIHYLHLLPTPYKFPRRREVLNNYDAWPTTQESS